jgi:hypothetical protein
MKQLTLKMTILLICLAGGVFLFTQNEKTKMSDMAFSNIEALANGDDMAYCYGNGNIDCPDGSKAEYVIIGLR